MPRAKEGTALTVLYRDPITISPPACPTVLSPQDDHWVIELAQSLEFEHRHREALRAQGGPGSRRQVAECLGRIRWAQAELARLGVAR